MISIDSSIGHQLRAARRRRGVSREQLAESLGVSTAAVKGFESGERRIGPERLAQICGVLKHPLCSFFGAKAAPRRAPPSGGALRGMDAQIKAHERALARAYYVIGDFRNRTRT